MITLYVVAIESFTGLVREYYQERGQAVARLNELRAHGRRADYYIAEVNRPATAARTLLAA